MNETPHRPGILRRLWEAILMVTLWRIGALRGRRDSAPESEAGDPSRRKTGASHWAQVAVPGMLGLCALAGLGFVALFVVNPDTQLLALCLGVALALLAGALIIAGRFLVPQETTVEQRPMYGDREADRGGGRAARERSRRNHTAKAARGSGEHRQARVSPRLSDARRGPRAGR